MSNFEQSNFELSNFELSKFDIHPGAMPTWKQHISKKAFPYQIAEAFPRVAELHKHIVGQLDELKVVEGENLLDFDLVIFVLVSSFDKVLHKMADKCKLLSY